MDEFLDYLVDLYESDELTNDEIERAINTPDFAYEVFMDCWRSDKWRTVQVAQRTFMRAKEYLARQKRGKSDT